MSGPSGADKASQRDLAATQKQIGLNQDKRAQQVYDATFPGLEKAANWYSSIASGDPTKIFTSIAPAASQVASQIQGAKNNITATMPRGGEQRLALENADVAKASQIGNLSTNAYTSSFPALANLGTSGVGLSVSQIASALQGLQGSSSTTNSIMQNDAASKASTMGMLGGVAQGAGAAASGGLSSGGAFTSSGK